MPDREYSDRERIEEEKARLFNNPRYRLQHYIAWRCGGDMFKKFVEGEPETRAFIQKNFWFLAALFECEEFQNR